MSKVQKVMTQPVNVIFSMLRSKQRVTIWLFEQPTMRLEGRIAGFDEYMNVVLDDAEELDSKKKSRKPLGRILVKGDNITLLAPAAAAPPAAPPTQAPSYDAHMATHASTAASS